MSTVIFRRRRLGAVRGGRGLAGVVNNSQTDLTVRTHNPLPVTRRREGPWPDDTNLVIRWGCTAQIPVDCNNVLNKAESIHLVNDKIRFRQRMQEHGEQLCPCTWTRVLTCLNDGPPNRVIVRPRQHAQGRRLYVIDNEADLQLRCDELGEDNYYISEVIDKVAEYRVFVISGRAVWVAQKTPGNPEDIAWNVARGGRFDNVRWGEWPLRVVRTAIEGFRLSGLDFGGVDVIVDSEGRAYVIEINSAPSQTSPYRISCTARAFDYIVNNGKEHIPLIEEHGGWRKFIHPALSRGH